MGQESEYQEIPGGLQLNEEKIDAIIALFTKITKCVISCFYPLYRPTARHFVKKSDPKAEALAKLRNKGPAPQEKVRKLQLQIKSKCVEISLEKKSAVVRFVIMSHNIDFHTTLSSWHKSIHRAILAAG